MSDSVTTTLTRNHLYAGDFPRRFAAVTIAASQTLTAGAVIGIITTGGQAKLLDTASTDGSEDFYGILVEDITTGAAETAAAVVAISGDFHSQALSLGGTTTVAEIISAARALNCYIHTSYAGENVRY